MDEFVALAEQVKLFRNAYRCNVQPGQEVRFDKNGCKWLRRGPCSVTVRDGPLVAKAQEWFPECKAVCSNRKRAASLMTSELDHVTPRPAEFESKDIGSTSTRKHSVLGKLKVQVLGPHPHPHIGHAKRGGRKNGDVHTVKLPPGEELPVQ